MDKQKNHSTTNSNSDPNQKPVDDYNFVLKGAKIDIIQPTREDLQEYEQFKSNYFINKTFHSRLNFYYRKNELRIESNVDI